MNRASEEEIELMVLPHATMWSDGIMVIEDCSLTGIQRNLTYESQ
jgi:hypothetical protein